MATPTPAQQDAIPIELRERGQWVGYRLDPDPEHPDKPFKRPINPRTGQLASVTDSMTWGTFAEAVARAERDGLPGVGFVFGSGDPYTFIDLDGCYEDDGTTLKPWAGEVVQALEGRAYIEHSQSGKGLHLILKGKVRQPIKRSLGEHVGIELYSIERYAVMTGTPYGTAISGPIAKCQDELDALCGRYAPKQAQQATGAGGEWSTGLTPDQIIANAKAAKNGPAFRALFDDGDLGQHGGDDSAADMALASLVAFWAGPCPSLIEEVLRRSALKRAKWDTHPTYLSGTLATVLQGRGDRDYYRAPQREAKASKTRFTIVTSQQLDERPDPTWLVKGMLPQGALAAMVAPPAGFKTFAALDIALSVSTGRPFAGHLVEQAPVLFISAEGSGGLRKRKQAWQQYHGVSELPHFHTVTEAVDLRSGIEVAALRDAIKAMGMRYGLVVVDTLPRCMPGADENSSKDMGEAVAGLADVAQDTGATILLLHHVNKTTGTIRGSTALLGALDVEIKAERSDAVLTLSNTKQKDADEFEPHYFDTKVVELGSEQSSLVLIRRSEPPVNVQQQGATTERAQRNHQVLTVLRRLLKDFDEVPSKMWEQACLDDNISPATFSRALTDLKKGRVTVRADGKARWYSLTPPTPADEMTARPGDEDDA